MKKENKSKIWKRKDLVLRMFNDKEVYSGWEVKEMLKDIL